MADLSIDQTVSLEKDKHELFFDSIVDPNFPSHHPFFNRLLNTLALEYGDEDVSEAWQLKRSEIRKSFASHFHRIIQLEDKKLKHAIKYLNLLREQSEPLESQIVSHMNSIIEEVEHDGLAIDQQLTLRKSYVSPAFNAKFKKSGNEEEDNWEGDDLLSSLIDRIEKQNVPIIIHGQPGHGKTSSVKMLLTALANIRQEEEKPVSVLFYEFKNLRALNNPVLEVLRAETQFLRDEKQFQSRETVLILDGLDERQITDGSDEELKGFVSGIFRMAERLNNNPNTKLNLILTGRSQFVGQIKSCFNSSHMTYEIDDFSDDKVSTWLDRFSQQKISNDSITIEKLKSHHLDELISQPILLTISAIMLSDDHGKKLFKKISQSEINRIKVYQTIVLWSYEKKWQHAPSNSSLRDKLSYDEYFQMLKAIAFEMLVGGEETIKLSKLAIKLKDSLFDLDFIENQNESVIEELCSQLRISFFFKGVEEKAFAFIHKSIKDFLIVEAVIDGLLSILEDCNIKKIDRISKDLFTLLGSKQLSAEDHIPMLDQLLESENKKFSVYDEKLLAIWERIGAANLSHSFNNAADAIEMQRNLAYSFYQILSRHFSKSSKENNLKLFDNENVVLFNQAVSGLSYPSLGDFLDFVFNTRISDLTFENQLIRSAQIGLPSDNSFNNSGVFNCNFSKIKMDYLHISGCSFIDCDFREVSFGHHWMSSSEFIRCDFGSSSIELLDNTGRHNYPENLVFNNKFIGCNFIKSSFNGEGYGVQGPSDKKRFLFWNCDLEGIDFGDRIRLVTVKYSKEYDGVEY